MTLLITDGLPRGAGVVEIDNRACDLPPGCAKHIEFETYTCSHCEAVVVMNPARKRERYKCKSCQHHICDGCAAEAVAGEACYPFKQRAEDYMESLLVKGA